MKDEFISTSSNQSGITSFFYIVPIVIFFGIVYAVSLSFVYIEGDDASSVLFHALGRNDSLQPPYSAYHGMMDIFLGILPASEIIVRHTAIAISALAAVAIVVLTVRLVQDWLPGINNSKLTLITIFILLCSPEIFYLGMIYTPSLIAMTLVLAAHLLIRFAYKRFLTPVIVIKYFFPIFFLSAFLFGIGVACRWDIGGLYLIVICADLILNNYTDRKNIERDLQYSLLDSRTIKDEDILNFKRIGLTFFFATVAFCISIFAIFLSGYNLTEILSTLKLLNTALSSSAEMSYFSTIGIFQAIFTPAFLVFLSVGVLYLFAKRKRSAVFVLVSVIPFLIYTMNAHSKMILPALPGLFLAAAVGINFIWFTNSHFKYQTSAKVVLIILLIIPWLVGLQVTSEETAWGPGFDIKNFVPASAATDTPNIVTNQVDDRSVSISDVKLTLDGGFAIPTPEGPRPLGGHAFVLLNGEWRDLALKLDTERKSVVEHALSAQLNILHDGGNTVSIAKLVEMNFLTNDLKESYGSNGISERMFLNGEGKVVKLQVLRIRKSLFDKDQILELIKLNPAGKVVLFSGYSSTIRKLFDTAPESISPLGPFSAIVNLDALAKTLD